MDYDGPMIKYGFLIRKQEDSPGQVARLEHHFIYQKVVYLIPDRDTHLGCIQSPAGAHREATNGCFYLTSLFLSQINKHKFGEDLREKNISSFL